VRVHEEFEVSDSRRARSSLTHSRNYVCHARRRRRVRGSTQSPAPASWHRRHACHGSLCSTTAGQAVSCILRSDSQQLPPTPTRSDCRRKPRRDEEANSRSRVGRDCAGERGHALSFLEPAPMQLS
jgi:hypothetical protein